MRISVENLVGTSKLFLCPFDWMDSPGQEADGMRCEHPLQ